MILRSSRHRGTFLQKLPYWLQKNAGHTTPTFMELSFNNSEQVSPQINAASHVPYVAESGHIALLLVPNNEISADPPASIFWHAKQWL